MRRRAHRGRWRHSRPRRRSGCECWTDQSRIVAPGFPSRFARCAGPLSVGRLLSARTPWGSAQRSWSPLAQSHGARATLRRAESLSLAFVLVVLESSMAASRSVVRRLLEDFLRVFHPFIAIPVDDVSPAAAHLEFHQVFVLVPSLRLQAT